MQTSVRGEAGCTHRIDSIRDRNRRNTHNRKPNQRVSHADNDRPIPRALIAHGRDHHADEVRADIRDERRQPHLSFEHAAVGARAAQCDPIGQRSRGAERKNSADREREVGEADEVSIKQVRRGAEDLRLRQVQAQQRVGREAHGQRGPEHDGVAHEDADGRDDVPE